MINADWKIKIVESIRKFKSDTAGHFFYHEGRSIIFLSNMFAPLWDLWLANGQNLADYETSVFLLLIHKINASFMKEICLPLPWQILIKESGVSM